MYRNEQVCKKLKAKHGLYFAKGKEHVKQYRLREPDKSKYEIYNAVKDEIGKSRNWRQLQTRLAEKGIEIHFKYRGQTGEVQGISFSKGGYRTPSSGKRPGRRQSPPCRRQSFSERWRRRS